MSIGILKVTDGTESISFLADSAGIVLQEWQPQTTQAKDGGIWSQSQFSDSRQMVMRNWANTTETFDVNIVGGDMDGSVRQFRKLQKLLTRAGEYWMSLYQVGSGAFVTPVWIEAQGDCETETRYAYIYDGSIPLLSNPHTEPFRNVISTTDTIQAIIEHGLWRDQKPGNSACLRTYSYIDVAGNPVANDMAEPTASTDDAWTDKTAATINTAEISLRIADTSPRKDCGVRFRGVSIPNGAVINGAYASLVAQSGIWPAGGTLTGYCDVFGELNATPAAFSTYANFYARTRTASNGDFELFPGNQNLVANTRYYTTDLQAPIQEIVSLPGWVSGGDIVLFFQDGAAGINDYENLYCSFDNGEVSKMPQLIIYYEYAGDLYYGVFTPVCEENFAVGFSVNSQPNSLYFYDTSTAVYSPNLLNILPTPLFPQPLGVGDRLYIGSDYPFANVEFNLSSDGNGTVTYHYHYSTAGGIAAGSISNVTEYPFNWYSGLASNGLKFISFRRPNNWAKNSIAGFLPNKYWIVIDIDGVAVAPTAAPVQATKTIYSTQWPFWEVAEDEVGGDVGALLKLLLVQYETLTDAGVAQGAYDHILLGTRHYNRGSLFTPYLNTQANATGITFAATAPAATATNSLAPCGQSLNLTTAGAAAEATIGTWTLTGSSLTQQYQGRYRVFVRAYLTTCGANGLGLIMQFIDALGNPPTVITQTDLVYNNASTLYDLVDLGYISLQNSGGLDHTRLDIALRAKATAAINIDILDIVLFPVDETNIEFYVDGNGKFDYKTGADEPGYQPLHDSTKPKEGPYSAVVNTNGELIYTMSTKVLGQATIPDHDRVRIFFMPYYDALGKIKGTESIFDGRFERVLQFRNMRGDE